MAKLIAIVGASGVGKTALVSALAKARAERSGSEVERLKPHTNSTHNVPFKVSSKTIPVTHWQTRSIIFCCEPNRKRIYELLRVLD